MNNVKPKEPLLAIICSLIIVGLGQIYSGRARRGILFFCINFFIGGGLVFYAVQPATEISMILLIPLIGLFLFSLFIIIDSYFCAKKFNIKHNLERKITGGKRALFILGIVFFMIVPGFETLFSSYIRNNYIQAFKMPSDTMSPSLVKGDRVLVNKTIYKKSEPQRGDIAVFVYPQDESRDFLKRVIAFENESVEIKNGNVFVNGSVITQPEIKNIYYHNKGEYGAKKVTVPEGHYYVLGDNSASSSDSRYWGFLPKENIIGKVYKIYWPPDRSGAVK